MSQISQQAFCYRRRYTGSLQAVIMGMAGTVLDFGSMAPVKALCRLFGDAGVPITSGQARIPMGSHKKEHIHQLLLMPDIASRWQQQYGKQPDQSTLDELYKTFVPLQIEVIGECSTLIPGAVDVLQDMKARGLKLGSNTGYNREMLNALLPLAREQGYHPDSTVCVDDVCFSRPQPDMCLKNMLELGVGCVQACVKIDDSSIGIEEGLNAGMWTIGLAISGNESGLTEQEWRTLSQEQQQNLRAAASQRLYQSGAHYVVDTLADIRPCLDDMEVRLARGDPP